MKLFDIIIDIIISILTYFCILNIHGYIDFNNMKNKIISKLDIINNFKYIKNKNKKILSILPNSINLKDTLINYIVFITGILVCIFIYFLSYNFLKVVSASLILGVYGFFFPYVAIDLIYKYNKKKMIIEFPDFLINLKNYTKTDNDIILALKKTKTKGRLKKYIDEFNILVQNGISVYEAFENLKIRIGVSKINELFTALQLCFLNGGDCTNILDKYINIMNKANIQKDKELQENYSSILVLITLIFINIFLFVTFIAQNKTYFMAITNTVIGKSILDVNILSYLIVYYFIVKIVEMEE